MFTIALVLASVVSAQESTPQPQGSAEGREVPAATPEQAWRTFLTAMIVKDAATLRAVTLPAPARDFEVLLLGQGPPPDQVEAVKAQIAKQKIRVLKPGDEFTLPGGRKLKVQPEEVGDDRAVLLPEGAPLPTRVRKVENRWRVDASPIIAGRKAAEAARKKAETPTPRPRP
jgi:hypothetical protein